MNKMYRMCLFFFKQKTAYEMRISDWSSDVCSSDLTMWTTWSVRIAPPVRLAQGKLREGVQARLDRIVAQMSPWDPASGLSRFNRAPAGTRSEEHTSELQSLMRISYAVFCLKKKN